MEKYNNLEQALTDLGWFHIDNFKIDNKQAVENILSYFDPTNLDSTGQPKITAKNKTIIICDNHDFNETYLIDLVSKTLKESGYSVGKYDLVLIDNLTARSYIKNPKFIPYIKEENFKLYELNNLKPCVIAINPEKDVIVSYNETEVTVITEQNVKYILNYLDNDFCEKTIKEK